MNTFNPLPLLIFVLAVVGTLGDWRYKRKGGKRPSRPTRIVFRAVLSLMVTQGCCAAFWSVGNQSLDGED